MANIRKRGQNYQIRVFAGETKDGKKIMRSRSWKPSEGMTARQIEKELKRQTILFEREVTDGYALDDRQTFEKYADYVLNLRAHEGLKHRTVVRYGELLQRINPEIGFMKLHDIRPAHLNKFYMQLAEDGQNKKTGGGLSPKTILEHHRLISMILAHAEKEMLVPYNAATKATPPKVRQKEAEHFEPEEMKAIFEALDREPLQWQVLVYLLALTGCRRGELAGLQWRKIDFDSGTITINQALLYTPDKGLYLDTPKTEKSIRSIQVPKEMISMLRSYRAQQAEKILLLGDRWENGDFLFTQFDGKPMYPDTISDWCKKFSKRNNLPRMNPHKFRHSAASIMIYSGMDIAAVSKRLGHASPTTTLKIYTHELSKADTTASEVLGNAILPDRQKGTSGAI